MGSIVAGFIAAVDPSAVATALTGANIEAENNYLSEQKKAQKNEEIQACKSWACAATVQVKWAAIDAGQDASFYSGVVAGVPAGLYDAVLGIVQAASSPLETYAALKSLFESGDVLERVPEAIKQSYIDRITRMEEEYQRAGADGSFSAGVEGGKLIFDVASLVTGVVGAARSGVILTESVTAKVAGNGAKAEIPAGGRARAGEIGNTGAENTASYPKLKDQLRQENLRNIAAQDSRLAAAVNGNGTNNLNFSIGQGSSVEANQLGKIWVGDGAARTSDGLGLISADGTRVYRPPAQKESPFATTGVQANFEIYAVNSVTGQRVKISNGHLNVSD